MREIRFRAWCKKGKGFIQGFNMVNFHSYYTKGLEPEIYRYSVRWKLSDIILMQYTGLEDNSGIGIYEGDIIKLENACDNSIYEVVIKNCTLRLRHNEKLYYDERVFAESITEVIGNIMENPELLGGKQ